MIFPRVDILDLCGVKSTTFWPMHRQELSRTAGSSTQAKDLGSALWRASFTTTPARLADAQGVEAALISLNGSVGSFLAHDVRRPFPKMHSLGDFPDDAVIEQIWAENAFHLRLSGLPTQFTLSPGDYLSFEYGSRPSRGLHMVMTEAKTNAGTVSEKFEVFPALRPGAQLGAAVRLHRPSCEMILEPGQQPPALQDLLASTVSFSAVQIL